MENFTTLIVTKLSAKSLRQLPTPVGRMNIYAAASITYGGPYCPDPDAPNAAAVDENGDTRWNSRIASLYNHPLYLNIGFYCVISLNDVVYIGGVGIPVRRLLDALCGSHCQVFRYPLESSTAAELGSVDFNFELADSSSSSRPQPMSPQRPSQPPPPPPLFPPFVPFPQEVFQQQPPRGSQSRHRRYLETEFELEKQLEDLRISRSPDEGWSGQVYNRGNTSRVNVNRGEDDAVASDAEEGKTDDEEAGDDENSDKDNEEDEDGADSLENANEYGFKDDSPQRIHYVRPHEEYCSDDEY